MDTTISETFDEFWRYVARMEDYIRQYGAIGFRPDDLDRWDEHFAELYNTIAPAFRTLPQGVANHRLFILPPGLPGANSVMADNAHQALMWELNPPERFFGAIDALQSAEHREVKRAAQQELRLLGLTSDTADLNDSERHVLTVIDDSPKLAREIADETGYADDSVRHILARLRKSGRITNVPKKGYVRG
jgi:hypothetical protein